MPNTDENETVSETISAYPQPKARPANTTRGRYRRSVHISLRPLHDTRCCLTLYFCISKLLYIYICTWVYISYITWFNAYTPKYLVSDETNFGALLYVTLVQMQWHICIYSSSKENREQKRRATAIRYWERASGYVLSAYTASQHYIEGSHDHIQVGVRWRL